MQDQLNGILTNLKILAIIVSIISAIVAGIGVINTMLMSVMERTKEIGTLKAVGWTSSNVTKMILIESAFIGLLGSLLGLILGYLLSSLITAAVGISTIITFNLVLQNFLFGFILGIIGGVYPAMVASKLDPIEALRSD